MAKNKAYAVFAGRFPGVYTSWDDVLEEVKGFPGAVYKGYPTQEEAKAAYRNGMAAAPKMGVNSASYAGPKVAKPAAGPSIAAKAGPKLRPIVGADPSANVSSLVGKIARSGVGTNPPTNVEPKPVSPAKLATLKGFEVNSWSVDAACSGNPGPMEYRGVDNRTGQELFRIGPVRGTNNIGEFLAIVHALALQQKLNVSIPIYSDSVNAMSWVKAKNARTKLPNTVNTKTVWEQLDRATNWLRINTYITKIIKWETTKWGENPADFGRK